MTECVWCTIVNLTVGSGPSGVTVALVSVGLVDALSVRIAGRGRLAPVDAWSWCQQAHWIAGRGCHSARSTYGIVQARLFFVFSFLWKLTLGSILYIYEAQLMKFLYGLLCFLTTFIFNKICKLLLEHFFNSC